MLACRLLFAVVVLACVSPAHAEIPCSGLDELLDVTVAAQEASGRDPSDFNVAFDRAMTAEYRALFARCKKENPRPKTGVQCAETPVESICGINSVVIEGLKKRFGAGRVRVYSLR